MSDLLTKETRKRSNLEIRDERLDLSPFFAPRLVAVIGASPKKGNLGKYIIQSLRHQQYAGSVVTVHPAGRAVADCPVVKDINSLPKAVDLAIVVVSASKVLPLLKPLAAKGVHHLIIISGGFSETGETGDICNIKFKKKRNIWEFVLSVPTAWVCSAHRIDSTVSF